MLDFGTARLPKRRARVGIWVARGLTTPAVFEEFRQIVARRPADGLRVVISLDTANKLRGSPARLLTGPSEEGPVWVSGDGAVLIVHGNRFDFKGTKQKAAVLTMAEAIIAGQRQLSVDAVLEAAACGPTVRGLSELFKRHPAWKRSSSSVLPAVGSKSRDTRAERVIATDVLKEDRQSNP